MKRIKRGRHWGENECNFQADFVCLGACHRHGGRLRCLSTTGLLSPTQASAQTEELEEIIVTGTSIRGVPPSGSNLVSVSSDDIKAIGAPTTPDLLASVPQLNSFNTAPKASAGGFGSFAPGLRSLPSSATLLLMNGHRLVGAAASMRPCYPDSLIAALLPVLAVSQESADVQILKQEQIGSDEPASSSISDRTLSDPQRAKIDALIRQLDDEDFDIREIATSDLLALGVRWRRC